MPSASDFDVAATLLTQAADAITRWTDGTRSHFGTDTLAGGSLTLVCHQAVDSAEHVAESTAEALRQRADLCLQRAATVRAYEAALGVHRTALGEWRSVVEALPAGVAPPPSPRQPSKPTFAP